MLTSIAIENFKGIGERVEIDLRPITLLFGANSAGKSSVLHALHYAREIFVHGNVDAHRSQIGGDYVDLGGFDTFLHGRERAEFQPITLRLTASVNSLSEPIDSFDSPPHIRDYDHWTEGLYSEYASLGSLPQNLKDWLSPDEEIRINYDQEGWKYQNVWPGIWFQEQITSVSVEVQIRPRRDVDDGNGPPVLLRYSVWINDIPVGKISLRPKHPGAWLHAADFNYEHPVLPKAFWSLRALSEYVAECDDSVHNEPISPVEDPDLAEMLGGARDKEEYELELSRYHQSLDAERRAWRERFVAELNDPNNCSDWLDIAKELNHDRILRLGVQGTGAMPNFDQANWLTGTDMNLDRVDCELREISDRSERQRRVEAYHAFLVYADILMSFPGRVIRNELRGLRYLGPLREVFRPSEASKDQPDPSRWASGLGAWDRLSNANNSEKEMEFVDNINTWLSDPERLGTGYRLKLRVFDELDEDRKLALLSAIDSGAHPTELRNLLTGLPKDSRLFIIPPDSRLRLRPHDVGTGISQVVPVIVSALDGERRTNLIEQPELHIHPKMQAELGSLFLEGYREKQNCFLVETHSEHLVLRLQRLIREGKLVPEEVSIVYVRHHQGRTVGESLRLDQEGDFLDEWPDGFFPERLRELR